MNKNNIIYYLMLFMIIGMVFALFEGAIIMSGTSTISDKLFWSAMNVMLFIGCPVGVLCIVKLSKTDDKRLRAKGLI